MTIKFKDGQVVDGFAEMGEVILALAKAYKSSGVQQDSLQTTASVVINAAKDLKYDVEGISPNDALTIFYYPKNGAHLMLPDIDDLTSPLPDPYPLPSFYRPAKIMDAEQFRLHRIGEYTSQKCL